MKEQNPLKTPHPDMSIIRRILFWDTKVEWIDWQRQKRAVIQRVFERGNEEERNEIIRFYGAETVNEIWEDVKLIPTQFNRQPRSNG